MNKQDEKEKHIQFQENPPFSSVQRELKQNFSSTKEKVEKKKYLQRISKFLLLSP